MCMRSHNVPAREPPQILGNLGPGIASDSHGSTDVFGTNFMGIQVQKPCYEIVFP